MRTTVPGAALGLLLAALAVAQEWHDAYQQGLEEMRRGRISRAARLFEIAARQLPQPGRDVLTYGTNSIPLYTPWIYLAEARLLSGDFDGALAALDRSDRYGIASPEERRRLRTSLSDALAIQETTPTPEPTLIAPTPAPTPEPTPEPMPTATSTPEPVRTAPAATPRPRAPATPKPSPEPIPELTPEDARLSPAPASRLILTTRPPGARVSVEGRDAGRSDPETGRLRLPLKPGRYEIVVEAEEHTPVRLSVELEPGEVLRLEPTLDLAGAESEGLGDVEAIAAVLAVTLSLLIVVWAWRRAATPSASTIPTSPAPHRSSPPLSPWRQGPEPLATPTSREALPEDFGGYRLVDRLGRGGMAVVYRAERGADQVALKRPLASFLDDPHFLERFGREAEIGRTLNHPNVIRIFERGSVDGVPYFTMELLGGGTLFELLRQRGRLPAREAVELLVQVGEALDYAHSKGVVHRDLKPSNIMILESGDVKVMDYGIARARRFEGLTATGAFLGTPDYIAPELIDGQEVEPRSDLYSLGVIFYEMATGRRPFSGDNAFAVMKSHRSQPPVPPTSWEPDLPPRLEELILRLLEKSPARRPATAELFVVELRDFLNQT